MEKNVVLVLVLILVSYLFGDFQGHDGGSLSVGQWVAVAYNEGFFIGKITAINMRVLDETVEEIDVNFLTKTTKGNYKWPKRKDTDIVQPIYFLQHLPLTRMAKTLLSTMKTTSQSIMRATKRFI